jgi:hypothetical protein
MNILSEHIYELEQNLNKQESPQAAWQVIEDYLRFFGQEGVNRDLRQMAIGSLTNSNLFHLRKAVNRLNMFFFCEYTELFVKAVIILARYKEQQPAK